LKPLTGGSVLTNQRVSLYKDFGHQVLLATVRSKENGMVGYQKMPFVAVLGTASVWTASGGAPRTVNGVHEIVSHSSLPATRQFANIALLSYQPPSRLAKFNFSSQVFAHFPTDEFEEFCVSEAVDAWMGSARSGLLRWAFARTGDSYLALGSDCLLYRPESKPEIVAANETCSWVCVVGSAKDFGDFDHFKQLCNQCEAMHTDAVLNVQVPSKLCLEKTATLDGKTGDERETRLLLCHWKYGGDGANDDNYDDDADDSNGAAKGGAADETALSTPMLTDHEEDGSIPPPFSSSPGDQGHYTEPDEQVAVFQTTADTCEGDIEHEERDGEVQGALFELFGSASRPTKKGWFW
jgi:hypothetical protein